MLRLLLILFIIPLRQVEPTSSIAINPERAQLLKDALGWMTFRKNGVLVDDSELSPLFLGTIMEKYATSKMYRTFVIAFQQGVLPRLTLKENDPCDPTYTFEYKDPFNNSVTWYYQKKFTFKAYDERSVPGAQFCDYRQGLVCKPLSKKCRCPEGSSMQTISGSSPAQRCLLDQDEICALVDIDHGHDRKHSSLAINLYHMIFNLEKPLSCRDGTQCRLTMSNIRLNRCYDVNSGPWYPKPNSGTLVTSFGQECVLGLYADVGSCNGGGLSFRRHLCYNFGPPRSLKMTNPEAESRTGFCFPEWGIFDISSSSIQDFDYYRPYFIAFVHPRTVPFRDMELQDYYKKYIYQITKYFVGYQPAIEKEREGERCTVSKTKVMEDAWEYFSSLEDDPPPGQDYVPQATKAELDAELQKILDLFGNLAQTVCKIHWIFHQTRPTDDEQAFPPLTCVADGSTDADGNDGTCQIAGNETEPVARKVKLFSDITAEIREDINAEESRYRKDILFDNPEPPCLPSLGPMPPQARHHNPDTLEGGLCPDGAVCYEDFSDSHDLYDVNCNLKNGAIQHLTCHDVSKPLEKCEKQLLDKKVTQALMNLDVHGSLGTGEACHYQFERTLRQNDATPIARIPAYQLLHWLERGILCDQAGQNLECTMAGTCECIGGRCKKPTSKRPRRGGSDKVSCFTYLIITSTLTTILK